MNRRAISCLLILAVCVVNGCSSRNVIVQSGVGSGEQFKQPIRDRGTDERSKWEVELKDGQKLKGYVHEIREDGFTLVNWKTDEHYEVRFDEMRALRHVHILPKAATIAIFAFIGLLVGFAVWGVTQGGG